MMFHDCLTAIRWGSPAKVVNCLYLCRLGQPGVELSGVHDDVNKVLQILPFANEEVCICSPGVKRKL